MQIYVCVKHVPDTAANCFRLARALINDDLPTLLRPLSANSGMSRGGHSSTFAQ